MDNKKFGNPELFVILECMKYLFLSFVIIFSLFPINRVQAAPLEVSGWIPYWKLKEGMQSAKKNISKLTEVYPFAYSLKTDGTLKDLAGLKDKDAQKFIKNVRANDVEVIPTVMSSSGNDIHQILSNDLLRKKHVEEILNVVKTGRYDGIDIDYESKFARTRPFFSQFLLELKNGLKNKTLVCTIEPRTPPDSLYREIPKTLEYANDYKEIGTHCDKVVVMAYDQQRADLKLNDSKKGMPYVPVSDVDWVRKVLVLTAQSIPKEKIILGIPTYGHEYEIIATPERFSGYTKLWALNPVYATDILKEYKLTPHRSKSGELSFSYFPKDNKFKILKDLKVPKATPEGEEAAQRALLYANQTKQPVTFNFVTWSDVEAVRQKVDLAKELQIRGVSLFKIDGGEDKKIWNLF